MATPLTISDGRLQHIARCGDAAEDEVKTMAAMLLWNRNSRAVQRAEDHAAADEIRRTGALLLAAIIAEMRGPQSHDVLDVPQPTRLVRAHSWHHHDELAAQTCHVCGVRRTDKEIRHFVGVDDCAGSHEARLRREADFAGVIIGGGSTCLALDCDEQAIPGFLLCARHRDQELMDEQARKRPKYNGPLDPRKSR